MKITQFQALNIVRTYNKQLKVGSLGKSETPGQSDTVNLSAEARRLGNGASPDRAFEKPAHSVSSSVETRIKSNSDVHIQRNLPFD